MTSYAGFFLVAALLLIAIVLFRSAVMEVRQRSALGRWLEEQRELERDASVRWRMERYCESWPEAGVQ